MPEFDRLTFFPGFVLYKFLISSTNPSVVQYMCLCMCVCDRHKINKESERFKHPLEKMFKFVERCKVKTLGICLLRASSPQEGKIAGAYWFLLSVFGAMLSGTQLIWYILLVLLHKCSFVCISSFHLLPFFKKGESGCSRHYSLSCIHQLREPRNYSPSSVRKVNLPVQAHRWMTVVSSPGLLARRCVYTDVSDASVSHPPNPPSLLHLHSICSSLCFSSGKQNAVGRERKKQQTRMQTLMGGLMMTSMKDLI